MSKVNVACILHFLKFEEKLQFRKIKSQKIRANKKLKTKMHTLKTKYPSIKTKSHTIKTKTEFFSQYVIVNCIDFRYRDLVVKTITDGFARGDDHVQCLFIGEHGKPF